jgi:hypothetical protein
VKVSNLPAPGRNRWTPEVNRRRNEALPLGKTVHGLPVKFTEWTRDDRLRRPGFLGIREDKNPNEVVREKAN